MKTYIPPFGLYCDFFLELYTLESIEEYSRFFFLIFFLVLTRVNKDLPSPSFLALGLRSCRIY